MSAGASAGAITEGKPATELASIHREIGRQFPLARSLVREA